MEDETKHNLITLPLFKLSDKDDLILFLIEKELIQAHHRTKLHALGCDTIELNLDMGRAIVSLIGITNTDDAFWEWYDTTLQEFVGRMENGEHINLIALNVRFKLNTVLE